MMSASYERIRLESSSKGVRLKTGHRYLITVKNHTGSHQILDAITGRKLGHAEYRLLCSDGSRRRGRLDASGRLSLDGLPGGSVAIKILDAPRVAPRGICPPCRRPQWIRPRSEGIERASNVKIVNVQWSDFYAVQGQRVLLRSQIEGATNSATVTFRISDRSGNVEVAKIPARWEGDFAIASWKSGAAPGLFAEHEHDVYCELRFVVECDVGGALKRRGGSGLLRLYRSFSGTEEGS